MFFIIRKIKFAFKIYVAESIAENVISMHFINEL
jgi:hypothetical protein